MKYLALVLFAMTLSLGCVKAPPNLSPQGSTAFTADQVTLRVNELMNTAIAANAAGVPEATTDLTRVIVQYCTDANAVLATTPNGWLTTLQTSWVLAEPKLTSVPPNSALGLAIAAADLVLGGSK